MSKFTLMIIGTIAIGLFALPGVISTFSGSHDYIAPENVQCATCHPEVLAELSDSQDDHTHANANWTKKQTLDCVECHTVSGIGDSPAVGHAAQKVDCDFCHDNSLFSGDDYLNWAHDFDDNTGLYYDYGMQCDSCHRPSNETGAIVHPYCDGNCHHPESADLLERMFLDDVYENIVDPDAAHVGFYENSLTSDLLLGGSESCIGCHTHMDFNMTNPLATAGMTYDPLTGVFEKE